MVSRHRSKGAGLSAIDAFLVPLTDSWSRLAAILRPGSHGGSDDGIQRSHWHGRGGNGAGGIGSPGCVLGGLVPGAAVKTSGAMGAYGFLPDGRGPGFPY